MTNSDGSLYDSGTFYVTEDMTTSLTMNSLITSCFNELYSRYDEVASSIATDDDSLIQNIGNLVNQQIAVIEESNRHLNNIDDFMLLLKNLRRGITQIVKQHAKVDIDNKEQSTASSKGIYYLDANNLYGGAMHRMMPYELVGVPERQEVMEKINRDPNGWVQSLKTFGKYGFFIECDIEAPVELHDKFNDLPFFPVQNAGMYSDRIKKYAAKNDIVDKVKEVNTPKLICDLVPRQKYLVHYSLLQLGIQQGYRVTHIHRLIRFKQAPFIFEYVNMLSEKRAKSKTTVEKNLYKLLANSTYGKFVETGLKRMKVKFANTWNEREAIIQKIVYKWPKSVEKGDRIEYGRKRDEKISRVWRHLLITLVIIITMIMFGMNR